MYKDIFIDFLGVLSYTSFVNMKLSPIRGEAMPEALRDTRTAVLRCYVIRSEYEAVECLAVQHRLSISSFMRLMLTQVLSRNFTWSLSEPQPISDVLNLARKR